MHYLSLIIRIYYLFSLAENLKHQVQLHSFVLTVNVIVVLDQERVYNDLKKQFGRKVQIVHLPKSGGVSSHSTSVFSTLLET